MQNVFSVGTQVRATTLGGRLSLCLRAGFLACGHQHTGSVNGRKCWGWGGEVVGDGRVGSVDEISRETRRGQNGVHGRGRPEEPPGGSPSVRGARKRGHARGVEGRREVEA
jgi:hypothetical protein